MKLSTMTCVLLAAAIFAFSTNALQAAEPDEKPGQQQAQKLAGKPPAKSPGKARKLSRRL